MNENLSTTPNFSPRCPKCNTLMRLKRDYYGGTADVSHFPSGTSSAAHLWSPNQYECPSCGFKALDDDGSVPIDVEE